MRISPAIVALIIRFSVTVEHVPVIMWSSAKSLWTTVNIPQQLGARDQVEDLSWFLDPVFNRGPQTIALFWQDKLNIHDIIAFDGKWSCGFPTIQHALDSAPSSVILPAITQHLTNQLPNYLQNKIGGKQIHVDHLSIWNVELNIDEPLLLLVKMPSVDSLAANSDTELPSTDEVIKSVIGALKAEEISYTAIFTTSGSPQVVQQAMKTGRQLLQVPSQYQYTPINVTDGEKPCILFLAKKVTLRFEDQPEMDLTNRTFGRTKVSTRDSICTADETLLSLNYGNVGNLKQLVIRFKMSKNYHRISAQNWFRLDYVQILYNRSLQATFNASEIHAPVTNSFHCHYVSSLQKQEAMLVPRSKEDAARYWHITLLDLQIQGFNIKAGQFDSAIDCASLFTPAVLMGLVTSLILMLVLAYAVHMVIHLKRMDNYNESKNFVYSRRIEEPDYAEEMLPRTSDTGS